MTVSRSDVLVLFGVTGDLAHKMIFPALYAMAKRGDLKVPVIGVASPKWSLAHLRSRVKDSIKQSGGIDNQRALHHLLSLLSYVSGDYNDRGTFTKIKESLGRARRPAHYLAIPPSLFPTVITGLGVANLADHARVIVEKPFGRDLASARELNGVARSVFPEDSILRIDHFLGKEAIMNTATRRKTRLTSTPVPLLDPAHGTGIWLGKVTYERALTACVNSLKACCYVAGDQDAFLVASVSRGVRNVRSRK